MITVAVAKDTGQFARRRQVQWPSVVEAVHRLLLGTVQLDAVANVANSAVDEYRPPRGASRRLFDRAHALVSKTADAATKLLDLTESLIVSSSPFDVFERMCVEIVQVEAIANAADEAIARIRSPSNAHRRNFNRMRALIRTLSRVAAELVQLTSEMRDCVRVE